MAIGSSGVIIYSDERGNITIESTLPDFTTAWVVAGISGWKLPVNCADYSVMFENPSRNGYSFSEPIAFRDFLELLATADETRIRADELEARLSICTELMTELSSEFDTIYGGKRPTDGSLQLQSRVYQKLGECRIISRMRDAETKSLEYLEQSINNHLLSSAKVIE